MAGFDPNALLILTHLIFTTALLREYSFYPCFIDGKIEAAASNLPRMAWPGSREVGFEFE